MASNAKKGLKSSIDDVLGSLLGDDEDIPLKSSKGATSGSSGERSRGIAPQTSKKGLLQDDFFSKMGLKEVEDEEEPDISDVDPDALLEDLKDMDDMEADLLGIKKTSSEPAEKSVKSMAKTQPLTETVKPVKKTTVPEKDIDDPLAGLLSDEEETTMKKAHSSAAKSIPETTSGTVQEKGTAPSGVFDHAATPGRKREELTFETDGDDLMDALGFGDHSKEELKSGQKGFEEEPRPARSMLDDLLGRGTPKKTAEKPGTGEDSKYRKQADKDDALGDEFIFGAYQPTVASTPEGRQSRRHSVRFSSENLSELKTEQRSKPSTPASSSPIRSKSGADWLGLKGDDFDLPPPSPLKESSKSSTRGAKLGSMPLGPSDAAPQTSQQPYKPKAAPEETALQSEPTKDYDNDSWLSNILSKKKSQVQEKGREKRSEPSDSPTHGEEVDPVTLASQCSTSAQRHQQSVAPADKREEPRTPMPRRKSQEQTAPLFLSDSRKGTPFGDTIGTAPTAFLQGPQGILQTPIQSQLLYSESLEQSSQNIVEYEKRLADMQAKYRESLTNYQTEFLNSQTRLTEVEGQVRRLELEKNQQKLLLESLQQRHQEDLDLIENAHKSRVKVIEDSYRQREERFRHENQELAEQYLSRCQSAEQAKSEMLAQHQRRLMELEQEKAKEVDRLQELQRMSILEMRKDHEEQLQRLKRLKAQEIDAVTSATSYTRSLNGIIEQMEKFSSNLNDVANKVEATHHSTAQGLETGARQRDEQLRVLQDSLARQQRDMEEERGRLQEVISKMEARLNEQARLLEQERWRVTAEQSKVGSLQHSLEEQRRVMTQQLTMEREELERAKSALVEEQKAVMQKCAEERRKLAAEWSELHIQQRLSKERSEREVDRALQIDCQREGAILSLAKEQADLKIKANELRSKEEQLVRDREILEQERQELRLEKERVNAAALHIKQRADEINSMSKLSSQKYEEGERALLEAKKIESEHQMRLRGVQQQMERLKEQEEYLHQEHLSLSHQRRQLEQLRAGLPSNPLQFHTVSQVLPSGVKANAVFNTHDLSFPLADLSKVNPGKTKSSQGLPGSGSEDLYAKLVLHKLTAERDHDFLEEEQFFLDSLKKTSYKSSPQSV
uniref:Fas binding factor 1 n=1 Tax=Salvator merianae TaxID=96440 RepID=A0A8D0ECT0_SALMN